MRYCPICNHKNNKHLYTQKFANNINHEIVRCDNCGFVFVSNTLNINHYNKYYQQDSKYEDKRDYKLHHKYFHIINYFFRNKSNRLNLKILDIGCATGHLLSIFKKKSYTKLLGIDPSVNCKEIAKKQFDIKVITADLQSFRSKFKHDVVILTAILEHLPGLPESINKITNLLSKNGYLFISIPDAANFYSDFEEPYGEFSIEHINFFSQKYLFLLLNNYTCCYLESNNKIIYSIWKLGDNLENSITKYISLSSSKLKKINNTINKLPDKLIIWGAGSLTQRLLETTNLYPKVYKLVDSNKNLIGKRIKDIEVISPNDLSIYSDPILISSFRFKSEIKQHIKLLNLRNKVIVF